MNQLPTYNEILDRAHDEIHKARGGLSEARDWLASDWKDGSNPDPTHRDAYDARDRARALISQAKALIDQAKNELHNARK
ncbi:MAG TPA: hypothetical protein VIP77_05550 [Jiangellaceae bacterium]